LRKESVLKMQPHYKIRKPAGCVNINPIFYNTIRYTQPEAGYITVGLCKEFVMTGDR
jgi:hypothetical protein